MKETFRKVIAIFLFVAMISSFIIPTLKVSAEPVVYGSGEYFINFSMTNDHPEDFTINSVTINDEQWISGQQAEYHSTNDNYTIVITVTKLGDKLPDVGWGGNFNDLVTKDVENDGNIYTIALHLNNTTHEQSVNWWIQEGFNAPEPGPGPEHEPEPEPQGHVFNGNAYFVWNCGGSICKYRVENMQGRIDKDGHSEYPINYIKESTVKDGNKVLEISNVVDGGNYFWVWDEAIDQMDSLTKWDDLTRYVDELDYDEKRDFVIDPTGAKYANNAINTNGDRCFRATIYDDTKYESIVFGTNESDYTYFLSGWDPDFFNSEVDLSGTTKEEPMYYETYMLEPVLKFSTGSKSNSEIESIKALDVNPGAVTINKENGEYTIKFNSNFYDSVIFELTDVNNKKYYLEIKRIVMSAVDNMIDRNQEGAKLKVGVKLTYPSNTSYTDYEVLAEIEYNDGTIKTVKAKNEESTQYIFAIGEFATVKEWEDGKNLKSAAYFVEVSKDVKDINFTVLKKNALNGDSFGGAFAGSGKGFNIDILDRLITDWYYGGGSHA